MTRSLWQLVKRHQNGLLAGLFVVAIAMAAFGAGAFVGHYRFFPYDVMREAALAVRAIVRDVTDDASDSVVKHVSEYLVVEAAANRIQYPSTLTAGLLWPGGEGLFREFCPERGCLAVEFSSSGELVHAYPYRLDEMANWKKIVELPRGSAHPLRSPIDVSETPHAVRRFSNGDLLVVFNYRYGVPGKGGIGRFDRHGMPVWVRSDYSHHWPTIFSTADGQENVLVPGMSIEDVSVKERLGRSLAGSTTDCRRYNEADHLILLSGDGTVLQDFRLIDKIIESPFAAMLFHTTAPCDILHLNYIDRIRGDVEDMPGVVPGDYVVSFRNISAFGIFDSETAEVKRMIKGTFVHQHSVQHLKGSEFLLFDNHGADVKVGGPSRVLLVDLAGGGVSERTIYPSNHSHPPPQLYSSVMGNLTVSQDRERVIVVSSNQGLAVEMQISDGTILNHFRNVHDPSGLSHNLGETNDRAVYVVLKDLQYLE